jgi:hypothetical protein
VHSLNCPAVREPSVGIIVTTSMFGQYFEIVAVGPRYFTFTDYKDFYTAHQVDGKWYCAYFDKKNKLELRLVERDIYFAELAKSNIEPVYGTTFPE